MRLEFRLVVAVAAFALGVVLAEPYARLAAPYYATVDRLIATGHPWDVTSVDVQPGKTKLSSELQLWGFVRRHRDDLNPAAKVQGRVQVGESVETPIVFWTLLLLWPAVSIRQRLMRFLLGVPVFLGLEATTTGTQLMLPMAQASAILAGDNDPVTFWDHWSRFLEAGGQFVLALGGAIIVASLASRRRQSDHKNTMQHAKGYFAAVSRRDMPDTTCSNFASERIVMLDTDDPAGPKSGVQ
jgi:hypothetical protein